MPFIFKHFWLTAIIFHIINSVILWYRSKKYSDKNPELKAGHKQLFIWFLVLGLIPWVVIGIGCLTGLTKSMNDFFHPRSFNPYVLFFHFLILVFYVLSVRWIYFKNGAEFIEKHPGFVMVRFFVEYRPVKAREIKWFFPLMLIGGLVTFIMMWLDMFPNFPFGK